MKKFPIVEALLTALLITALTTGLYLYTSGYRLTKDRKNPIDLQRMGMVSAKSIPEGATVYLDGNLVTATNDTISGIEPAVHHLKIKKKGFVDWEKEIEVFPELVTDITAVLVSQSPRLEPLTNTGARFPIVSPSMSKIAFFSEDIEKPGVWITQLANTRLNIFGSSSSLAIPDTLYAKFSEGVSLEWSPDEKALLIQSKPEVYYLVNIDGVTTESVLNPEEVRKSWVTELAQKRSDFIQKLEIPENLRQMALSPESLWAPDEKKFLYTVKTDQKVEYHVYNMEKPIPVGEKPETLVLTTNTADAQPKISWYADSYHLVMVEGDIEKLQRGTISIIRIDGTNKAEIYNNTLMSSNVFSLPSGDKLVITTSFKSAGQTDLYTVGIR